MPVITNVNSSGIGSPINYGTTTNDNALPGMVGEVIESNLQLANAVTLSNGIATNVTSIDLTAGDWDITGMVMLSLGLVTGNGCSAGISMVSNTMPLQTGGGGLSPGALSVQALLTTLLNGSSSIGIPSARLSLATTTTVYLVSVYNFSLGTTKAYGSIWARRAR